MLPNINKTNNLIILCCDQEPQQSRNPPELRCLAIVFSRLHGSDSASSSHKFNGLSNQAFINSATAENVPFVSNEKGGQYASMKLIH